MVQVRLGQWLDWSNALLRLTIMFKLWPRGKNYVLPLLPSAKPKHVAGEQAVYHSGISGTRLAVLNEHMRGSINLLVV